MTIPALYREIFRDIGIGFANFILIIKHGPEVFKTVKEWLGFAQDVERRIHERRHHMTLSEILKDAKLAESLAPQLEAVWTALDNLYKAYEALNVPPPPAA